MIDNRLISSNSIIAKIMADLDLSESLIPITSIKDWIGEAMEKIGAVLLLEHKVANVEVVGHLAKMPCDLYRLNLVAFASSCNGGWSPMRKVTGSFGVCDKNVSCDHKMIMQDSHLIPLVKSLYNIANDVDALEALNNNINIRLTLGTLLNRSTTTNGGGSSTMMSNTLLYYTKPGYVVTTLRCGWVKMSYHAIYTDCDGMPLIPDSTSYSEAIYWYVTMKMMYPKRLNGKITRLDYLDIVSSWNYYRKLAYGEAMTPSTDDLETIRNTWTTLMPEVNEHSTFFSVEGDPLNIYNLNN